MSHDPAEFWDDRYAERERIWSGRPNQALVDTVGDLPPGRALDLGCGEGADSIWLAERGWQVTGVDVSATAVARARAHAEERGVTVDLQVHDLAGWEPSQGATGTYDLVSAAFLHTPLEFPRTEVLRRAGAAVVPGGHLFVLGHAEPPPWATGHDGPGHGPNQLMGPEEEVATLALDGWETVVADLREREATGPDGQHGLLRDSVVLLRRLTAS